MLPKFEALEAVKNAGVVAVVRGRSEENSYKISKASSSQVYQYEIHLS